MGLPIQTIREYKRSSRKVLTSISSILAFLVMVVFVVDPFQHYRSAGFYKPIFDYNRYLNPGLAKNLDYDTAIIGTSMVMNFRRDAVNNIFGGDTVNLSVPAGSVAEQSLTMRTVLDVGKAKRIILGLDYFQYVRDPEIYVISPFPFHLYDNSPFNDYKYLLNYFSLKVSYYIFEGNVLGRKTDKFDRDRAYNSPAKFPFGKEYALESYKERFAHGDLTTLNSSGQPPIVNMNQNFDNYILPYIKGAPGVEFYMFFPPYSYLTWLIDLNKTPMTIDYIYGFKGHVLEATRGLPNVKVFDFQSDSSITFNLDNYMDVGHYSSDVSRYIVESMAEGRNLLTEETLPDFRRSLTEQVGSVSFEDFNRELGL